MSTDINMDLRKLSKTWSRTEAKAGGGGSGIKDGDYVAEIVSMDVNNSKKTNRLQVVEKFRIAEGKYKGKEVSQYHGIESEQNIGFFKGHCEVIGLEVPEDPSDLPNALETFVSENSDMFDVRLKTNDGGYQNVTVLSVAGESSSEESSETSADNAGDDKPVKKAKKNRR